MTPLSLIQMGQFFTFDLASIEKPMAKSLIKIGLLPNKYFKVYLSNLNGGVVVGDECLRVALDRALTSKLLVSKVLNRSNTSSRLEQHKAEGVIV